MPTGTTRSRCRASPRPGDPEGFLNPPASSPRGCGFLFGFAGVFRRTEGPARRRGAETVGLCSAAAPSQPAMRRKPENTVGLLQRPPRRWSLSQLSTLNSQTSPSPHLPLRTVPSQPSIQISLPLNSPCSSRIRRILAERSSANTADEIPGSSVGSRRKLSEKLCRIES